jgi:sulfur-oxidizing protein SoxZ
MAKPRIKVPKSVKKGEIFLVKSLISHKMESGQRKDKKSGEKIPRLIINKFEAKFNGETVFSAVIHPAISANPYMSFYMKADKSGELELTWTDDKGKTVVGKKTIKVI